MIVGLRSNKGRPRKAFLAGSLRESANKRRRKSTTTLSCKKNTQDLEGEEEEEVAEEEEEVEGGDDFTAGLPHLSRMRGRIGSIVQARRFNEGNSTFSIS